MSTADVNKSAPTPRTAEQVISSAIAENKSWEWVCWLMVIGFGVTGLSAILVGLIFDQPWAFGGSAVAAGGFWTAFSYAHTCWRENQFLRMLELGLSEPKEAKATHEVLRQLIRSLALKEKP